MTDKMRSFLKGLAMGLCGKPLEFAPGKEPVAYLYNGVRLPKLPEWDKEKYPYAVLERYIYPTDGTEVLVDKTTLTCSPAPFTYEAQYDSDVIASRPTAGDTAAYMECHIDHLQGETNWGEKKVYNLSYMEAPFISIHPLPYWTNSDIIRNDGNGVWLAASEPVPVYE